MAPSGSETPRHWSREPMVWLLVAVPLVAVIGGIATAFIAAGDGSLDASLDPVRRTAQIQQTDLGPDREALRRGLVAQLRWDGRRVDLQVDGDLPRDRPLRLRLVHPTRAAQDIELELLPADGHWTAPLALPEAVGWSLRLGDADGHWRLDGDWPHGQREAVLRPRFSDG